LGLASVKLASGQTSHDARSNREKSRALCWTLHRVPREIRGGKGGLKVEDLKFFSMPCSKDRTVCVPTTCRQGRLGVVSEYKGAYW